MLQVIGAPVPPGLLRNTFAGVPYQLAFRTRCRSCDAPARSTYALRDEFIELFVRFLLLNRARGLIGLGSYPSPLDRLPGNRPHRTVRSRTSSVPCGPMDGSSSPALAMMSRGALPRARVQNQAGTASCLYLHQSLLHQLAPERVRIHRVPVFQ